MATDRIIFKVHGEKQLFSRLNSLDRKTKRRIATKAIRAGAKIQVKALRSATPKDSGAARKAIGTKVKTYRNSGVTVGITGERYTKRTGDETQTKSKFGGPHLHLIEYGTKERFQTGQKAAVKQLAALTAIGSLGHRVDGGRVSDAKLAIATGKARSKVARRIAKGTSVSRAERADLRSGRRTGRVTPRPFFKRVVKATAAAARAALIAVLRREIPAEARTA